MAGLGMVDQSTVVSTPAGLQVVLSDDPSLWEGRDPGVFATLYDLDDPVLLSTVASTTLEDSALIARTALDTLVASTTGEEAG